MHAPTVREDTHLLLRRGRSLAKNINLVEGEARYRLVAVSRDTAVLNGTMNLYIVWK